MPTTKVQPILAIPITQGDRSLIFDERLPIPTNIRQIILEASIHEPVKLPIDDWERISGLLAAEANHTEDRKWESQLDRLFRKIPV